MNRQAILDRLKLARMAIFPLAEHPDLTDLQRDYLEQALVLIHAVQHGVDPEVQHAQG